MKNEIPDVFLQKKKLTLIKSVTVQRKTNSNAFWVGEIQSKDERCKAIKNSHTNKFQG